MTFDINYEKIHKNCLFFRALDYGALGMIIGHEISHAFDSTGEYKMLDWPTLFNKNSITKLLLCNAVNVFTRRRVKGNWQCN